QGDHVVHGCGNADDPRQPFVPACVKVEACPEQEPDAKLLPAARPVEREHDDKEDEVFLGAEEHGLLPCDGRRCQGAGTTGGQSLLTARSRSSPGFSLAIVVRTFSFLINMFAKDVGTLIKKW